MRKEKKQSVSTSLERVNGYHQSGDGMRCSNYAWSGFNSLKYYASDRPIALVDDCGTLKRSDGKPIVGYGLEIELESQLPSDTILATVLKKIVFDEFPAYAKDLFKLQHDSSLAGISSAECITQIMTKAFIRNHYQVFKAIYDTYFPAFQIVAGDSCGMHVNISNAVLGDTIDTQAETCKKLYYFINCHYDLCCALFRRSRYATRYCSREITTKDDCKSMNLSGRYSSHGVAFNLGHWDDGRIEIRLVAGQLNYASFRNTMETIFHLIDACKRLSWDDLDDMPKVFKSCNQHVLSRIKFANGGHKISDSDVVKITSNLVAVDWE